MPRNPRSYLRSGAGERIFGRVLAYLVWIGSRGPRAKERQDIHAADGPDRARGAALPGLRPRQFQLGAQCPHIRRSRAGPRDAPPLCDARTSPGIRSPILKAYLDRFAGEVQRFFLVPKGSPVEAFSELAPRYPVFELQPLDETALR